MAETTKLSVEKALEKLRGGDDPKSKNEQLELPSMRRAATSLMG